jgi:hypothetical protein
MNNFIEQVYTDDEGINELQSSDDESEEGVTTAPNRNVWSWTENRLVVRIAIPTELMADEPDSPFIGPRALIAQQGEYWPAILPTANFRDVAQSRLFGGDRIIVNAHELLFAEAWQLRRVIISPRQVISALNGHFYTDNELNNHLPMYGNCLGYLRTRKFSTSILLVDFSLYEAGLHQNRFNSSS